MEDASAPDVSPDARRGPLAAPRLLVTGFGPFPGIDDNPSGRAARAVDGAVWHGVSVIGLELPTLWAEAWARIAAAVERHQPDALVMLGVAAERQQIEIERVAHNHNSPSADADGRYPERRAVVPGGPTTLPTSLPWSALIGPGVGTSDDAGRYLCNHVFYRAAHALADRVAYCGFVHLPLGESEALPGLLRGVARHVAARRAHPPTDRRG